MSKLMIALFITAGLGIAGAGSAQTYVAKNTSPSTPMTKDNYAMVKKDADAQYKIDKEACSSLNGNAKDICVAEAKGKDNVAKADAEASYANTPKARESRARRARQGDLRRQHRKVRRPRRQPQGCLRQGSKSCARQRQGRRQGRPCRGRYAQGRHGEAGPKPARKRARTSATPTTR